MPRISGQNGARISTSSPGLAIAPSAAPSAAGRAGGHHDRLALAGNAVARAHLLDDRVDELRHAARLAVAVQPGVVELAQVLHARRPRRARARCRRRAAGTRRPARAADARSARRPRPAWRGWRRRSRGASARGRLTELREQRGVALAEGRVAEASSRSRAGGRCGSACCAALGLAATRVHARLRRPERAGEPAQHRGVVGRLAVDAEVAATRGPAGASGGAARRRSRRGGCGWCSAAPPRGYDGAPAAHALDHAGARCGP